MEKIWKKKKLYLAKELSGEKKKKRAGESEILT